MNTKPGNTASVQGGVEGSPGAPGALLLSLQQQEGGGDLLLHLPPPALPGQGGGPPAASLPPVPHVRAAGERGAERRGGEVQAQAGGGLLEVPGRLPAVEVREVWRAEFLVRGKTKFGVNFGL